MVAPDIDPKLLPFLLEVKDPEIPVLNVVEMGIIRAAKLDGSTAKITITPTYSGCPAMHEIEIDIKRGLGKHGIKSVIVELVHSPAWTTDWLSDEAKVKLKDYGIAPPGQREDTLVSIGSSTRETTPCPYCGSKNTSLRSEFGSTACKSLHFCNGCRQPFEHFKAF